MGSNDEADYFVVWEKTLDWSENESTSPQTAAEWVVDDAPVSGASVGGGPSVTTPFLNGAAEACGNGARRLWRRQNEILRRCSGLKT